jgi:3-hydroxyisobutyrate dehydrogenase-like beta-hydroxyacid dehydrogenase
MTPRVAEGGSIGGVGLVGVGLMGKPIARHIVGAGFELACFDVDERALAGAREAGATVATTLADLASSSDVVLVIVPTDEDVLDVCLGNAGILAAARPGTIVAICSSVRPSTCALVAEDASGRGIQVLDVALTKGTRGAEAGELTLFAGGDAAGLERARPVLESFSGAIHHLGPLGAGQAGKTVNNLIHWVEIAGITEALILGWKLGLDVSVLRKALQDASVDSHTLRAIHLMPMTWPEKDLANALAIADEIGEELPVATVVREAMRGISHDKVERLLNDEGWEE